MRYCRVECCYLSCASCVHGFGILVWFYFHLYYYSFLRRGKLKLRGEEATKRRKDTRPNGVSCSTILYAPRPGKRTFRGLQGGFSLLQTRNELHSYCVDNIILPLLTRWAWNAILKRFIPTFIASLNTSSKKNGWPRYLALPEAQQSDKSLSDISRSWYIGSEEGRSSVPRWK